MVIRVKWLCRKLHGFLLESYFEAMEIDANMPVRVCELDCEDCDKEQDIIREERE